MNKEFYLIRHAESMGNIGLDNSDDPGLSPRGHAQANKCAELMKSYCDKSTIILCSPFERCLKTADEIAETNNLKIKIAVPLHETFLKVLFSAKKARFLNLKEKAKNHPLVEGIYSEDKWWPEKNEANSEIKIRMGIFRNTLLSNEYTANKIICIGHWGTIGELAHSMVPKIDLHEVKNASITHIIYQNHKFKDIFINKNV